MKQIIFSIVTLIIFTLTSCKKDDNTNAQFSVQQNKSTKSVATKSPQLGTFTFTKARLGISEIDFEIESDGEDQEFAIKGAYQFDILTGTSTPALNPVEITPGTYHELEFEVSPVLDGGKSLEIAGTYELNGITFKFEYTSNFTKDYDIENETGVSVNEADLTKFILYIDLKTLFTNVAFTSATVDADGVIRINANSNASFVSIIENNLNTVMDFDDNEGIDD